MENRTWSWTEFILGWLNKQFLVWAVATALVFFSLLSVCNNTIGDDIKLTLVIVWGVISFCLFFYKAIHILIENGKLNVEAKANIGISKEIK